MVGVGVGEEHGMDVLDVGTQGLGAEIGGGIDQDVTAAVAKEHGGPQAIVARVGRRTDGAMAADGRHPHTGARAEHGDLDGRRRHSGFLSRRFSHVVGHLHEAKT
jgi:hypothetical protein